MTQYESVRTPQDYVNYTFNISSKGVTQVAGELAGLSSTVSTILGDIAFKTSEFLSHTETMAIGAGTAVSAVFVKATQDAIRFEQQVANVKAIGGESVNAALIGDKAMEYSNKFGMAVSDMTEGLEALARAGITTTSVMTQVLEEGVKLSKLEGISLEDSINHLISTTNLLSQDKVDMNAPEYAQMLKDMNQHIVSTSESAPINAENIIQTLQHVGGYASASNIDQDDLFAVIAQLGGRGTKGEMAGTALRAFIAAGNKDTAQRALSRVGLSVGDLWDENGETMLSISEMKNVLDSALEARGYSKQEKLEFYSDFVGYKQANQIMKIDTTEVEKYKDNIANAWDLGTKLNTILGTVRGNLDRIWQISQNFMTKVGSKLLPVINAMLVPIRVGLELFTKIPFMDSLGAGLALFAGLRTILLVINNIVPAIGGLFSSIRSQKQYSKGIRGEWEKTRDAIKDAYEVLSNWNNKDKLAQIHRQRRGVSAEDKAHMEETIFQAMYYESSYFKELKIPWDELEPGLQHAISREFLGTSQFEENWKRMQERNETIAGNIGDEAKVLDFGEYDTEGELSTINRYVQYIYSIIKETNSPKSKLDQNKQQHMSGGSTKQETSRQPYSGGSESPKVEVVINGRNTSQNAFQFEDINKLKSSIDVSKYGDYEHIYRNNVQQLIKDYNQAINDLVRKTNSFSNTKKEHMDKVQMRRYEKSLRREAMSEEGIRFASRANDSDIRYYLRTGVYRKPKDKMLGIKDDQIKAMAEKVGLDFSDIDNITGPDKREEQLAKIRQELKKKNISIDDVAEEANRVWVESQQAKRRVTYVPTQLLRDNEDMTLQLAGMFTQPTDNINQAVKQVQSFFANETDEATIASATRAMMGHLKLHGQTFSKIEEEEIKYILENIVRLENTASKLNIGLEDSMRVFSETADYNHINKQLTNFWNNSGVVDDLVDNMIDAVVGQFTIVQELVAESYIDWIKSSTPGAANNIDISAIESRLRNKLLYTQQEQISTDDINDAILLKELYNETDMYNILLRRNFTESNRVIRTWGNAPDLRYTELTNPSTGEKYRYNKEYGILNKQKMNQIFQTRHVDKSSFIIDEDLNEIYDDAVKQWKQKTAYSLSDISGENGYLHPLLGPLHESFDDYSVDELLHRGMYRKNGIGFSLTNPKEVQEAILTGLISERQVKTWIKKGLLMPSDYIDDTLSWKASGYDGQYFNREKHREQTRKKIDEEHATNQLERERLDKISDVTSEAFDYAREKGQKSIALKNLVQQISSILSKEKDLKYDNDDIYNAIKEYADYRSNAVDIKDDKAILNKTKGIKRVRSAKDILYRDWFDENLEISWAAHQMLGIPLGAKPTDVLKDILAGNIENVDENTKLFRTRFNAGTGSKKYSADSAYSVNKKFFESDYTAARFFGLPLLVEKYQDELPIIKDLLEEGKRFEAYIELMRNADNINYDDLDYEISHDSKLTNSEIESLQHELIDVRQQAKEVADGIEFELEHLGTVEYFTNVKTPEQLEKQRLHKEKMLKDEYAKHGKTVLSGLDIQAMVKGINERGGRGDRLDIFIDEIGEHWGNATNIIDFVNKIDESAYELIWSISTERFDNIMKYINSGDISKLDEHVAHMLHLDSSFDNRVKVTGKEMYDLAKASYYYNGGLGGDINNTVKKFFTPIDDKKVEGKSLTDISFLDKELANSELYYISKEDYEALKNIKSSFTLQKDGGRDTVTTYVPGYMPSRHLHNARYVYDKDEGRPINADEYIEKLIKNGKSADFLASDNIHIPELQKVVDLHNNGRSAIGYGLGTDKSNFQDFTTYIFRQIEDDLLSPTITNARNVLRSKYTGGEWANQTLNNNENRIHNYGIYYDPKEWGRIVNLLDTSAVKEAFMQDYITERQLKKWEQIYYTPRTNADGEQFEHSFGHEEYGDLGYTMEMVEAWKKEKETTQEKLNEAQNTVKEIIEEVTVQILPILSLMSATIENDKKIQKQIEENTSEAAEKISSFMSQEPNGKVPQNFDEMEDQRKAMLHDVKKDSNQSSLDDFIGVSNKDRTDRQIIDNDPIIIDIEEDNYWEDKKQRSDAFWAEQERIEQEAIKQETLLKELLNDQLNIINGINKAREEELAKNMETAANMFNMFDEDYEKNKEKYQNRVKRKAKAQKIAYNVGQYLETASNIIKEKVNTTNQWLDKNFLPQYESKYDIWGEIADSIEYAIEPLEVFNRGLHRLSDMFPVLIPLIYGLDKALGVARFTISTLRDAEILLMAIRIASGKATEDLAEKEGYETAKKWAKKMNKYIPKDSDLFKLGERFGEYGTRALNGVKRFAGQAIGFIAENIVILGPIAAAIAIAVGALWLSEQNHAKALKKATEEHEAAHKEAQASYITYKNLHQARKNENDAIKRQQLARKESTALYKLEADRLKQLNAIKKETDLRNDYMWGEYGKRAQYQKMGPLETLLGGPITWIAKWMAGDFESQYQNYEGSTGEIRHIKEDSMGSIFATSNQRAVSAWYDSHIQQLGHIEAFAPQLQELYALESKLIEKYGSLEAARNSDEFEKAVKEFADATGINKETAKKYLDYLQMEANVENARDLMQAEVSMITSQAHANAYKALYGDESGIGDTEGVEDAMVYATADQIFKDAYQDLWWSMLMEWLQAIYNVITLNWGEADKHAKAAGAYQDGMRELAENQQRITQEGVDIAKENQRKDYENDSYTSSYGDTPFGGAVASSAAQEQSYAEEEMNRQDMYYNASRANGEAATQGFKDGLDQHSPGKIARSMRAEMIFSKEAIERGGESVMGALYNVSDATASAFSWMGGNANNAFNEVYNATSDVFNIISDGAEWVGGTIFNALTGGSKSIFKGFSESIKKPSNIKIDNSKTEVHIHTVNINTDDDPEKIKTALMELIIEFGDLVTPKQVSRIIGTPPATSTSSTEDTATEDENAENTENTENSNTNTNNTPTT